MPLKRSQIAFFSFSSGYLRDKLKNPSQPITTGHYLAFLSSRHSALPVEWVLTMFERHLESEREKSYSDSLDFDPTSVAIVQRQLLDCIRLKHHQPLAGQCLAKCSLFHGEAQPSSIDQDPYQSVPSWILEDLILVYSIDPEQTIVECTRATLKTICHQALGQELYQKVREDRLIELYAQPFLTGMSASTSSLPSDTIESVSNPWLISPKVSFEHWLFASVNALLKQIDLYYREKNETGHPYALVFLQLRFLTRMKLDLAKKVFPHLIFCLLLLPSSCNVRPVLSKQLTYLLEQLLEHQYPSSTGIAELLFRTMNYLRQCPIDTINKRNPNKSDFLNFENHFWLDLDYFQLARCASKYQCYQSAIIYADIWTTKQRSDRSSGGRMNE